MFSLCVRTNHLLETQHTYVCRAAAVAAATQLFEIAI